MPENFASNDGQLVEGYPGGNLGKLLSFLEKNNYSVVFASDAHQMILQGLQTMAVAAQTQIAELRALMRDLRDGTLDIWNPPKADVHPKPPGT